MGRIVCVNSSVHRTGLWNNVTAEQIGHTQDGQVAHAPVWENKEILEIHVKIEKKMSMSLSNI